MAKIDKFTTMVEALKKSGVSLPRIAIEPSQKSHFDVLPFDDENPEVIVSPYSLSFTVGHFGVGPSKVSVLDSVLWLVGFEAAKVSGDLAVFAANERWNEGLVEDLKPD